MKHFLSIFIISLFILKAAAQNPAVSSGNKPTEKVTINPNSVSTVETLAMKEVEFDFGKIPQGKPVTHIFDVTNIGKDSLHISNVQASCGCTTPEWERDKKQAPGEKTKITVGYNAASEGAFSKQITITYNGTQTKLLTIKGEVWKTPVTSAPENKELGSLKDQ